MSAPPSPSSHNLPRAEAELAPAMPVRPAREGAAPEGPAKIGRFVVLRKLGEGGMGIVYAAYDEELERKVAIKLLRNDFSGQKQSVGQARLLREAQAMARLSHPNVAQIYEVGKFGAAVYIAMEFISGSNLREWLQRGERPWRTILGVYVQAGHGLAAAHAAGIVHRDFKPKPSRLPPKAPLSAKRRGSPQIGALRGRRFAQEWSGVVRMAQSWPKIEARSCYVPSGA